MANVARDEENLWEQRLQPIWEKADGAVLLKVDRLCGLHTAEQRRLIRQALREIKGDLNSIGIAHIDGILALLDRPEGAGRLQIPGLDICRSFEWLRIGQQEENKCARLDYSLEFEAPAQVVLPRTSQVLHIELIEASDSKAAIKGYNEVSLLDFERLRGPLTVRNWRPGDRYAPEGSEKKIKQLFQRDRIPVWERQGWPVMTSGDKIVWAKQFGAAAEVAPDSGTRTLLHIREESRVDSHEPKRRSKASERRDTTG
jgi:tRNA(Ile)-lysidine synthase